MSARVLVAEPDPDIRTLLELTVRRFGHTLAAHDAPDVDVVLMEPGCPVAHSLLERFHLRRPPIVCVSIHPPEHGLAPEGTIAYLMKPLRAARLRDALAGVQPA